MEMSSVSSTVTQFNGFNKMIQDFKKALSERKLPRNLAKLNIIVFLLTAIVIIISGVEYSFKI